MQRKNVDVVKTESIFNDDGPFRSFGHFAEEGTLNTSHHSPPPSLEFDVFTVKAVPPRPLPFFNYDNTIGPTIGEVKGATYLLINLHRTFDTVDYLQSFY